MELLVKPSPFRHRKSLAADAPARKKYGCLMAVIDGEVAASVRAWARGNIPESELGKDGYEDEIHATVLYGFEDDQKALEGLKELVGCHRPFSIKLNRLTCFEDRGDGAPLIVGVYSPELCALNDHIRTCGEYEHVTKFPKYVPHLTVAYVLPECVEKYTELETSFTDRWVEVTHMVYSTADRVKTVLPLGVSGQKHVHIEPRQGYNVIRDRGKDSRGGGIPVSTTYSEAETQRMARQYIQQTGMQNADPIDERAQADEKAVRVSVTQSQPDDHDNCPVCGEAYSSQCRCRISNRRCKNGHDWHRCPVHKRTVLGTGHGSGGGCTCGTGEKTLSSLNGNLGGALVPPPARGLMVSPFRNRKALQPHEVGRNRDREIQKRELDRLNDGLGRRGALSEDEQAGRPGQLMREIATGAASSNEREEKALTPKEERTNRQREYFKQRLDGLNSGRQAGRVDPDDTSLSQEDLELETGADSSNEREEKALTPGEREINKSRRRDKITLDSLNNSYRNQTTPDPVYNRHEARILEGTTGGISQNVPEPEEKSFHAPSTKAAPDSLYDDRDPNTRRIDEVLIEHDATSPQKLDAALTAYERSAGDAVPPPLPARGEPLEPRPAPEPPIYKGPQPAEVAASPFRREAEEARRQEERALAEGAPRPPADGEARQRARPEPGEVKPSPYQQRREAPEAQLPPRTEAPRTQPQVTLPRQAPAYPQPSQGPPPPLLAPPPPGLPQPATAEAQSLRERLASDAPLSPQDVRTLTSPEFLAQVPPEAAAAVAQRLLQEAPKLASTRQLPTLDDLVRPRSPVAQPQVAERQPQPAPEAAAGRLAEGAPPPDPQALAHSLSSPALTAQDAEAAYAQLQKMDAPQLAPYVKEVMGGFVPPPVGGKDEKQHYLDMLKTEMDSKLRANEGSPRPVARPKPNYAPEPTDAALLTRTGYTSPPQQQPQQQRSVEPQGAPTVLSSVPQEDHDPRLLSMQYRDAVLDASSVRGAADLVAVFESIAGLPDEQIRLTLDQLRGGQPRDPNSPNTREFLLAELREFAAAELRDAGFSDRRVREEFLNKATGTLKSRTEQASALTGQYRDDEKLMTLFGAPQGAMVASRSHEVHELLDEGGKSLGVGSVYSFAHPAFETMERAIGVDKDGNPFMRNVKTVLKEEYRGMRLGAAVFTAQVKQARQAGFKYITNMSYRGTGYTGWSRWPELGYNKTLEEIRQDDPALARDIAAKFPGAQDILDVMSSKDGREWWRSRGRTVQNMRFDLAPDSKSSRVLDAYNAFNAT